MYQVDLMYFVGVVTTNGATNLRHGMSFETSEPVPAELDTRKILRYLYSTTPFTVTGRQAPRESREATIASDKICVCK